MSKEDDEKNKKNETMFDKLYKFYRIDGIGLV